MQVSDNSILYFISGEDEICKYDGNGSYQWEGTSICEDIGRTILGGAVHLDRIWWWSKDSSFLAYSTTLKPEDFSTDAGDIVVGQETDSVIRRVIVGADETLYVFKNNSIWQLFGRTVSSFQFRKVTDKYGLATKRAICPAGSGFIFLDEFTKELYFFGGNERSIIPLTERDIKLRDIIDRTQVDKVAMTVHDGYFRFAFKHRDDSLYQDRELVYAIDEPGPGGLPKWSMIKGSKVLSYSVWNREGDNDELVTGRSDTGKIMYHSKPPFYRRGKNWDTTTAIETQVRTKEVIVSDELVARFSDFFIKARPGSTTTPVKFSYFLDGRYSEEGIKNILMSGETREVGELDVSQQAFLNDRIQPLHDRARGTSISFEVYDNNLNTDMELYSIAYKAKARYKVRNQLSHVT